MKCEMPGGWKGGSDRVAVPRFEREIPQHSRYVEPDRSEAMERAQLLAAQIRAAARARMQASSDEIAAAVPAAMTSPNPSKQRTFAEHAPGRPRPSGSRPGVRSMNDGLARSLYQDQNQYKLPRDQHDAYGVEQGQRWSPVIVAGLIAGLAAWAAPRFPSPRRPRGEARARLSNGGHGAVLARELTRARPT